VNFRGFTGGELAGDDCDQWRCCDCFLAPRHAAAFPGRRKANSLLAGAPALQPAQPAFRGLERAPGAAARAGAHGAVAPLAAPEQQQARKTRQRRPDLYAVAAQKHARDAGS